MPLSLSNNRGSAYRKKANGNSGSREVVSYCDMAAFSLFWNTNMAAVTSHENDEYFGR